MRSFNFLEHSDWLRGLLPGISRRTANALVASGLESVQHILTLYEDARLPLVKHLGPVALGEIERALWCVRYRSRPWCVEMYMERPERKYGSPWNHILPLNMVYIPGYDADRCELMWIRLRGWCGGNV